MLLTILMFASAVTWAQDGSEKTATPVTSSSSSGKENADDHARNAFGEEFRGHFSVTGEVAAQQQYDDNAFPSAATPQNSVVTGLSGRLSFNLQRKRSTWEAHYVPSFRIAETGPDQQGGSHQVGTAVQAQLSARTHMFAQGSFAIISSQNLPGQQFVFVQGQALPVFYPDVLPLGSRNFAPAGSVGVSHQFSRRTELFMTVSGNANLVSREDAAASVSAGDSYSAGPEVGVSYRISAADSLGMSYRHVYLGFSTSSSAVNSDALGFNYSRRLGRDWQFSGSVGPTFIRRRDLSTSSYAASASLMRRTLRYSYGFSYQDGVQSSAVQDATSQRSVAAHLSRTFSRRLSGGLSFGYSESFNNFSRLDATSYSGSASAVYTISEQLAFSANYSRLSQGGISVLGRSYDRNLYSFGLTYYFKELFRRQS